MYDYENAYEHEGETEMESVNSPAVSIELQVEDENGYNSVEDMQKYVNDESNSELQKVVSETPTVPCVLPVEPIDDELSSELIGYGANKKVAQLERIQGLGSSKYIFVLFYKNVTQ